MFVRGNDCAHGFTIVSITDRIFVIFVLLYSLCNYIEYQSFKYVFFYLAAICIPIKSHQSNQTRSTTLRTLKSCKYSSISSMNILINEKYDDLSTLYWIPKLRRNPYRERYITSPSTEALLRPSG
jgi:hypothetical protein